MSKAKPIVGYQAKGRAMARAAKAAKRTAEDAKPEGAPAPLPAWLRGDKSGLPMKPPGAR